MNQFVLDEGAARNLKYLLGVQLEYDPPTAALPNESITRLCMHGPRNDGVVAVKEAFFRDEVRFVSFSRSKFLNFRKVDRSMKCGVGRWRLEMMAWSAIFACGQAGRQAPGSSNPAAVLSNTITVMIRTL